MAETSIKLGELYIHLCKCLLTTCIAKNPHRLAASGKSYVITTKANKAAVINCCWSNKVNDLSQCISVMILWVLNSQVRDLGR